MSDEDGKDLCYLGAVRVASALAALLAQAER
jgi:hypothetical protein